MELCEEFFQTSSPPIELQSVTERVIQFVRDHHSSERRIALVAVCKLAS